MTLEFTNSLTRRREPIPSPPQGEALRMYACGVTVYDRCHIGHARSLYVFDVFRRSLRRWGIPLRFVRNITDIDDKIIAKARETGRSAAEVAEENVRAYRDDMALLGVAPADKEPRATDPENIAEMIRAVEGLVARGHAYAVGGDVYFRVRTFPAYGRLSGQSVDRMREAVRIERDARKTDPLDFALWKASASDEPGWPSPWGRGRPGWHIECSCMSLRHLETRTLDIHAGGRDLIFPHHENEIAQAEALTGVPFARCWVHHGLITIHGQKMAKSLGNVLTIAEAVGRYGADRLKMFFLGAHYASALDFSEERMAEAGKACERLRIFLDEARRTGGGDRPLGEGDRVFLDRREADFDAALEDDLNTPKALAALFRWISETYKRRGQEGYPALAAAAADRIRSAAGEVFGLGLALEGSGGGTEDLPEEIRGWLEERKAARALRDYARADALRDRLRGAGIVVEDTPRGQIWRRA